MRIPAEILGRAVGPRSVTLSPRRIMAFAAATGDRNPRYFDDTGAEPLIAPPLLSVSLEWPLIVALRTALADVSADALRRGVHATHDVTFHRPARAGETLHTTATVVAVEQRRSGVFQLTRLETVDADGRPVTTTYNGGVYRGVELDGAPASLAAPPALPRPVASGGWETAIEVPWNAAHVYTECAEIWNPIHTERSVALAAGLPEIILHGTATLGYAAQEIVDRACGGDPARLQRIAGRFGAMVLLGSRLRLHAGAVESGDGTASLGYAVETADGGAAIRDGVATIRDQVR